MNSSDDDCALPEWRIALRKSQNPCASHYYRPDEADALASVRERFRASENPYAFHHYFEAESDVAPAAAPARRAATIPAAVRKRLSKVDFEAGCRSIFRRYMPDMERAKLRAHHQDFIRRNVTCSPERRYALLEELKRYDLGSEPGLRTYFNREEDAFTEAKLLKIEESVKDN